MTRHPIHPPGSAPASQALPKWLKEEPNLSCNFLNSVIASLVMCASPTSPYNGDVTITTLSLGATVTYSCNCGFELIGAVRATCTMMEGENKPTFIPAAPTCRRSMCYINLSYIFGILNIVANQTLTIYDPIAFLALATNNLWSVRCVSIEYSV